MNVEDLKFDIREWNEWIKIRFQNKDFISLDDLLNDYENLIFEVERLEEEIQDLEQDMEDNYKHIPKSEQFF